MSLTYESFYYPFGKGQATFDFSNKIKQFKEKYFETVNKSILVSLIYDQKRDIYDFFFKVPSSENGINITDIFYDTIVEFEPDKKNKKACENSANLKPYNINIFSNSPGFTFTFTYVIKHRYNAFPKCISNHYLSKVALQKSPDVRNSYQLMTMEKTTWWSLFHLDYNGYLNKDQAKTLINKENNLNKMLKRIETQPEKLKELQEIKKLTKEERDKLAIKKNKNIERVYNKPLNNTERMLIAKNLKKNMKGSSRKNILKKNLNFTGFSFGSNTRK